MVTRYVLMVALDLQSGFVVGLTKQRGPASFIGKLTFPGGKIEPGETPRQAASREMREETGLAIAEGDWRPLTCRRGADYELHAFAVDTRSVLLARTCEDEPVWVLAIERQLRYARRSPELYSGDFLELLEEAIVTVRAGGAPWPLTTLDAPVHVGTMRAQDKGARGPSLEGSGLSVSCAPQAWVRIAKLGGLPWWQLSRARNRFLDAHALDASHREALLDWGRAARLIEMAERWEVQYEDDELGGPVTMLVDSLEAVLDVLGTPVHEGLVQRKTVPVATAKLCARAGQSIPDALVQDLLLTAFAEYAGLDGVYWDDALDAHNWSAPRAVIAASKLSRWQVQALERQAA